MTAPGSSVAQFASAADEIFDLVERLVDCSARLQQLEQAQSIGDDLLERLAAFDARLTALEKRQRRPPAFPISVIENVQYDPKLHPFVVEMWQRRIDESIARLRNGAVAQHDATFDRMGQAFANLSTRIAAVEARVGDGEANGGA
jgi:hypothetical protein